MRAACWFQELFDYVEDERMREFDSLALRYKAIGPLLVKMEGLVTLSNSGKNPKLQQYYAHWERKIYQSITTVSIKIYVLLALCLPKVKSVHIKYTLFYVARDNHKQ